MKKLLVCSVMAVGAAALAQTEPRLSSPTATGIDRSGAWLGASIDTNGGQTVTSWGTAWDTSPGPTGNVLAVGSETNGAFSHWRGSLSPATRYYFRGWASNAVGTGYSPDGEFYTEPDPASAVSFTDVAGAGLTVNWVNGNGSGRLVVMKEGGPPANTPADGVNYPAGAVFGGGANLGGGEFVVYAGAGSNVVVSGLWRTTRYDVAVFEFAGSGSPINYRQDAPATGSQTTLYAPAVFNYNGVDGVNDGSQNHIVDWGEPTNWIPARVPDGTGDVARTRLPPNEKCPATFNLGGTTRTLGECRLVRDSNRSVKLANGAITWDTGATNPALFYVRRRNAANPQLRCGTAVDMRLNSALVWDGSTDRSIARNYTSLNSIINGIVWGVISGPGQLTLKWHKTRADLYNGNPMFLELLGGAGPNTHEGGTVFVKNNLGTRAGFRLNKQWAAGLGDATVMPDAELYVANVAVTNGGAIHDDSALYLHADAVTNATVELEAGVNETVRALFFYDPDSARYEEQGNGTWGSSASAADNRNDQWFRGPGILTVRTGPGRVGTLLIVR